MKTFYTSTVSALCAPGRTTSSFLICHGFTVLNSSSVCFSPGNVSVGHITYLAESFNAQSWEEGVKKQKLEEVCESAQVTLQLE